MNKFLIGLSVAATIAWAVSYFLQANDSSAKENPYKGVQGSGV